MMAALKRYNLAHLAERFRENKVDAVAYRSITEAMGVAALGDRIKLLETAREMGDEMARMAVAGAEGGRAIVPTGRRGTCDV